MPPVRSPATSGGILGSFVSLGSSEIAARGVAFLATTYLTRALGPDGFGILGLATALCGYFAVAVRSGFDDVGARDVARRPDRVAEIAAGATLVRLVLAAIAMLLVTLVAALLPKPPVVRLVVVLTGLSFFSLALDTSWLFKGLGRNVRVGVALVSGQMLYAAIVVSVVRGPEDLIRVPLAQVAGELVTAAVLLLPLLHGGVRPDIRGGIAMVRASGFLMLTRLLRTMIYTFGVVLIGLMLGEFELGLYSAAYRFCFLLLAVAAALHVAFLPAFARVQDPTEYRGLAIRAIELSAVVAVPFVVGGAWLAGPLLAAVFGAEYGAGAAPFRLLLLSIGFIFLHGTMHNLLLVLGRTRDETRIIAVAAFINGVISFLLIPRLGLVGAAFATALAEGFVVVLGLVVLARAGLRLPLWRVFPAIGAAGAMVLALQLLGPDRSLPLQVGLGAVVYGAALLIMRGVPPDIVTAFARHPRVVP